MTRRELNAMYRELEVTVALIVSNIDEKVDRNIDVGFYNGHYVKNDFGEYERLSYPIPVITVKGLCDVEIGFDNVTVSAKLNRDGALQFDYSLLDGYKFEAYGVEDYLSDYRSDDGSVSTLLKNIQNSKESEIGFQFSFGKADGRQIVDFLLFIEAHGFYS